MSSGSASYVFYLNRPISISKMRSIYSDIVNYYPAIQMSMSFDDMVRSSFDILTFSQEGGSKRYGEIFYDEAITIQIILSPLGGNFNPTLKDSIKQGENRILTVDFESWSYINYIVADNPKLGYLLEPLLTIIAKHSNPFYGFYTTSAAIEMIEDDNQNDKVNQICTLISQAHATWGSLYCDTELASDIGFHILDTYAESRTPVEKLGFFVERSGIPLRGYIKEQDISLYEMRNRMYFHDLLPKICKRIQQELC